MKFIFECSNQYLTSEHSERVGYRFEHEKINIISPSNHIILCLLYKPTNYDVFDDFPKIANHFPKISEDLQNVVRRLYECFQPFSELFRRLPRKIRRCFDLLSIYFGSFSIETGQTCQKMFRNRYLHMWNNMLFSRVKIWFFRAKDFLVFHWCLYNK